MSADEQRARRCRNCWYVLEGLPSPGDCPECSVWFDLSDPSAHTLKLPYIGWKFWLPVWIAAGIGGVLTVLIVVLVQQNWGAALWIGVPLSMGMFVGYIGRFRAAGYVIAALTFAMCFFLTLVSLSLAGAFCGLSLAAILFGPLVAGAFVGWVMRRLLRASRFSQRDYLASLLFLLIPVVWASIEGPGRFGPAESITTREVVTAPVNAAWRGIVFFEDVRRRPPLILRIGLAHPLHTYGRSTGVGDRKTCVYNRGHITKEVVEIQDGRLLAFRVVEQNIGYEHDVRLIGGQFAMDPLDEMRTEVALTTTYEPRLAPRFVWRPFERLAVHTLHRHVIGAIGDRARELEGSTDANRH